MVDWSWPWQKICVVCDDRKHSEVAHGHSDAVVQCEGTRCHGDTETQGQRDMGTQTRGDRDMGTQRHEETETWGHSQQLACLRMN